MTRRQPISHSGRLERLSSPVFLVEPWHPWSCRGAARIALRSSPAEPQSRQQSAVAALHMVCQVQAPLFPLCSRQAVLVLGGHAAGLLFSLGCPGSVHVPLVASRHGKTTFSRTQRSRFPALPGVLTAAPARGARRGCSRPPWPAAGWRCPGEGGWGMAAGRGLGGGQRRSTAAPGENTPTPRAGATTGCMFVVPSRVVLVE